MLDHQPEATQADRAVEHATDRVGARIGLQQCCFGRLGLVPDEFRYPLYRKFFARSSASDRAAPTMFVSSFASRPAAVHFSHCSSADAPG